jgi:mannitol-1-phosphate/altronate dehydrogenase
MIVVVVVVLLLMLLPSSIQDGLFTVLGRDPESTTGTVVGSVVDCIYGPDDPTGASVIHRLAHPQTRIVSLTITEKGYCLDVHNHLDLTNALVRGA